MKCSLGDQLKSTAYRYQRTNTRLGLRGSAASARRWRITGPPGGSAGGKTPGRAAGPTARRSRLEAVLFLAREPLSLRKLAQLANLTDGTEARSLLQGLRQRYDERGCAFQVVEMAGGYQLMSRPKFFQWLRPLADTTHEVRLSPPALETLAVVAHRQPVGRAEIEAIRGVGCGEILRQLMERDLLRIVGRSEELGQPLWYGTTKRFLQVFGLPSLEQLPLAAELRGTSLAAESTAAPSASYSDHGG